MSARSTPREGGARSTPREGGARSTPREGSARSTPREERYEAVAVGSGSPAFQSPAFQSRRCLRVGRARQGGSWGRRASITWARGAHRSGPPVFHSAVFRRLAFRRWAFRRLDCLRLDLREGASPGRGGLQERREERGTSRTRRQTQEGSSVVLTAPHVSWVHGLLRVGEGFEDVSLGE